MKNQYNQKCNIKNCNSLVGRGGSKGMCGKHAIRMKRYGDPNYLTPESIRIENNRNAQLARFKKSDIKKTTYRKFFGRHEHRVIAEQILGRKLKKGEIVHHKDGNKHNNKKSNLQIMTQSEHTKMHYKEMMKERKNKHGY